VQQALRVTAEAFGSLNVLFNNAGVGSGPGWDATIKINLEGVYNGLYYGAEMMAANGGGSIINTSSILGLVGMTPFPGEPIVPIDYGVGAYSASKGAVVMMTRQFAVMYGARGVRVNALAPGFIKTPMTAQFRDVPEANDFLVSLHPMGRLGIPEEIASAAAFLASDEASFINGVILPVDGGYTAR
jgi:NAD(P)-dependent dehydrogenase (short-subunit alcohol dehydrogenase family)